MAISDEELKIFVPEGTIFQSVAENKSAYGHIKQDRYIGIEEALELADSLAR